MMSAISCPYPGRSPVKSDSENSTSINIKILYIIFLHFFFSFIKAGGGEGRGRGAGEAGGSLWFCESAPPLGALGWL